MKDLALLRISDSRNKALLAYAAKVLLDLAGLEAEIRVKGKEAPYGLELPGVFVGEGELLRIFSWLSLTSREVSEFAPGKSAEEPWISKLAQDIARRLGENTKTGKAFRVIITHDVDRTLLGEPFSFLKTVLNGLGAMKRECYSLSSVLDPKAVLRSLEKLLQFEADHGIRSVFFVMSGPYSLARYGTRYDVRWSASRRAVRLIQEAGMQIGLHGSYYAAQKNRYGEEKKRLEDVLGREVALHRNHYLHIDPYRSWGQLEKAGFAYDFSVGFRRGIGFRVGAADRLPAFDLSERRTKALRLVPLIFMDGAVDWEKGEEAILERIKAVLQKAKAVAGTVSLLFHPEFFILKPQAWKVFVRIVDGCQELGADMAWSERA